MSSVQVPFNRLAVIIAGCVLVSVASASTINVPAQQPTIQAGINAAVNGDTVLVAPGTYAENINFSGKAITVTSSGGPITTTSPFSTITGFDGRSGKHFGRSNLCGVAQR